MTNVFTNRKMEIYNWYSWFTWNSDEKEAVKAYLIALRESDMIKNIDFSGCGFKDGKEGCMVRFQCLPIVQKQVDYFLECLYKLEGGALI